MSLAKRLFAALLASALILCALPLTVLAVESAPPISFTLDEVLLPADGETFHLRVNYDTDKDFCAIRTDIYFDREVLIADLPTENRDKLIRIGPHEDDACCAFNGNYDDCFTIVGVCHCSSFDKADVLVDLPFKLANGVNPAEVKITISVSEMKDTNDPRRSHDFILDDLGQPLTFELPVPFVERIPGDALLMLQYAAKLIDQFPVAP